MAGMRCWWPGKVFAFHTTLEHPHMLPLLAHSWQFPTPEGSGTRDALFDTSSVKSGVPYTVSTNKCLSHVLEQLWGGIEDQLGDKMNGKVSSFCPVAVTNTMTKATYRREEFIWLTHTSRSQSIIDWSQGFEAEAMEECHLAAHPQAHNLLAFLYSLGLCASGWCCPPQAGLSCTS